MPHLLDTSVLVGLADKLSPRSVVALHAVLELHRRGEVLYFTPQVLVEFRNVATRPTSVNGLGMSAIEASNEAAVFEARFPMLPDTPDIYPAWKAIVAGLGVIGKRVHDARLAAVCHVHAVTHILTFNVAHFAAMANFSPGITVVDPAMV